MDRALGSSEPVGAEPINAPYSEYEKSPGTWKTEPTSLSITVLTCAGEGQK
jgi:hypothetical protein